MLGIKWLDESSVPVRCWIYMPSENERGDRMQVFLQAFCCLWAPSGIAIQEVCQEMRVIIGIQLKYK